MPLGAFCHRVDEIWHMHAMVVAADGDAVIHIRRKAPAGVSANEFGQSAADELRSRGALELLADALSAA